MTEMVLSLYIIPHEKHKHTNFDKTYSLAVLFQDDIFGLNYERIKISIDERNIESLKLFKSTGFIRVSTENELINFVYRKGEY